MPRDSDAQEIIATIKRHEPVTELSVPVLIDTNTVGTVTIGLSEFSIEQQIAKAVLSVVAVIHPPPEVGAFKTVDRSKRLVQKNIRPPNGGHPPLNSVSWSSRLSSTSCFCM